MELHKKEKEMKHALTLMRERSKLIKQKNHILPIKLDKPIHHGYVRSLELRDDVKHRNDYPKILEVINFLGQHKKYHSNKDFITRKGKNICEEHAHLKSVRDPRFCFYYTEAKRTAEIEKIKLMEKYLWYHTSIYNCSCDDRKEEFKFQQFQPHYYFKFPWMLKEVTNPYYLTHYTPVQGELESRLHEIETELYNNNYYTRFVYNRNSSVKLDKLNWLAIKYDDIKSRIYHSLNDANDLIIS